MTDIIYDTTTGTILQPDSGTKLYLDLNNDQCQVIEDGGAIVSDKVFRLSPDPDATGIERWKQLCQTTFDVTQLMHLRRAAAGRALLQEIARSLVEEYDQQRARELTLVYENNDDPSDLHYMMTRLVDGADTTLKEGDDLDELVHRVAQIEPEWVSPREIRVYTKDRPHPLWRVSDGSTRSFLSWDPITGRGAPGTLIVRMSDLLDNDQRL